MDSKKRDKKGRFIESSNLDSKTLGVRLFKTDREKLNKIAEEKNTSPGQLVRELMHKFLNEAESENFNVTTA